VLLAALRQPRSLDGSQPSRKHCADASAQTEETLMAKNSIDAYGALGKSNVLYFDPEALVLVTDESSPLYDPRVHLPVSEALVLNIMHQGVLQAISINKNTESGAVEVVAGRQRVKAAREANKRLAAKGCEPVQVPALPRRGEGADLAGVMVSENECREDDSPIGRAEKMRRLMSYGKTEADLTVLFGCTTGTVKNTLALLDCCADVRKAVSKGAINAGHALKLSKLEPAQQRETLAKLVSAGSDATGHEKARKQRAVIEPTVPKMRTRKEVQAKLDTYVPGSKEASLLRWVLGS
jgi:ParB family chromosome partitioning protein